MERIKSPMIDSMMESRKEINEFIASLCITPTPTVEVDRLKLIAFAEWMVSVIDAIDEGYRQACEEGQ